MSIADIPRDYSRNYFELNFKEKPVRSGLKVATYCTVICPLVVGIVLGVSTLASKCISLYRDRTDEKATYVFNLVVLGAPSKKGHGEKIHPYPGDLKCNGCRFELDNLIKKDDSLSIPNTFGVDISIKLQNLLDSQAHFVVNAANAHLKLGGGGVNRAIQKGGKKAYNEAHTNLRNQYAGEYPRGYASLITSGDLTSKDIRGVIVVAGPRGLEREIKDLPGEIRAKKGKKGDATSLEADLKRKKTYLKNPLLEPEADQLQRESELYSVVYNTFSVANEEGPQFLKNPDEKIKVAMPLVSSGLYGFPADRAAHITLSAIHNFLQENPDSKIGAVSIHYLPDEEWGLAQFEKTLSAIRQSA